MEMIGNKMQGTGLSDILLEFEVMSCGSLVGVLKGKLCTSLELPQSNARIFRKTPV